MKDALTPIPYIVCFGNFIDETSVLADLILPDHSFLESWVQSMPESGAKTAVVTSAGPVMQPLHDTRSTPDVLIDLGKKLKKPVDLGWQNFEEMVKTKPSPAPASAPKPAAGSEAKQFSQPQLDGDANEYAS